ncbi:hypothetical protein [Stieleria sp. JC731]|nr:hypothetical protein [Stieleria sp. JC731]
MIIHLVPNSRAEGCGVTDYASAVCDQMQLLDREYETKIIRINAYDGSTTTEFFAAQFWGHLKEQLAGIESDITAVVLHYSGYGYSRDGAPDWLAAAMNDRPDCFASIPIVTFFHELYATAWPWRRTFWHSSRQRRVAESLAKSSDHVLTNRRLSASWLSEYVQQTDQHVGYLPVPSNIGEPIDVAPYASRKPIAILFGSRNFKRAFAKGTGAQLTADICQKYGIKTIVDIGTKADWNTKALETAGIELQCPGYLSGDEVLSTMLSARVGFFNYYPDHLEKSGILAAFARCGVPLISPPRVNAQLAQLIGIEHPPMFSKSLLSKTQRQFDHTARRTSECLHQWSLSHGVKEHAEMIISTCLDAKTQNEAAGVPCY